MATYARYKYYGAQIGFGDPSLQLPIWQEDAVIGGNLRTSEDGATLFIDSDRGETQIRDIFCPSNVPELLCQILENLTGHRLDESGRLEPVPDASDRLKGNLAEITTVDLDASLRRWLLARFDLGRESPIPANSVIPLTRAVRPVDIVFGSLAESNLPEEPPPPPAR